MNTGMSQISIIKVPNKRTSSENYLDRCAAALQRRPHLATWRHLWQLNTGATNFGVSWEIRQSAGNGGRCPAAAFNERVEVTYQKPSPNTGHRCRVARSEHLPQSSRVAQAVRESAALGRSSGMFPREEGFITAYRARPNREN